MVLNAMRQPNRTLYGGAGIYIMGGYDFYYEVKTRTKANNIITQVLASLCSWW